MAEKCPKCGSINYVETTMGWFELDEHSHDPNEKTCCHCQHSWYTPCPKCGETYAN